MPVVLASGSELPVFWISGVAEGLAEYPADGTTISCRSGDFAWPKLDPVNKNRTAAATNQLDLIAVDLVIK